MIVQTQKEKLRRINVSVPADLHKQLRIRASERRTIRSIVVETIVAHLNK